MKRALIFCFLWLNAIGIGFAQKGSLGIYSFEDGKPYQGLTISIGTNTYQTNDQGTLELSQVPGKQTLTVSWESKDYSEEIFVADNLRTIVLINVKPGFAPAINVEAPDERLATSQGLDDSKLENLIPFKGRVISMTDKSPIEKARVFVRGVKSWSSTDENGAFTIQAPAGEQVISIIHPQFATLNGQKTTIEESERPAIFLLTPVGIKLSEFVVTAPHIKGSMASLMDERRLSAEVMDVIGAEQISKSGDSDAGSAIKRVTGLTLESGKYPFIRGMGGRYVTTLLNGFNLPSPNPSKRVVPLDMFPTGILEGISVVKSSSADRLSEFGGGHILLKTKSIPDDFSVKFSMGSGIGTGSQEALYYKGGDTDWLGIDDGTRELPELLANATQGNKELTEQTITNPEGLDQEELELIGESFNNNYNVEEKQAPINRSFSLSMGGSTRLFDTFRLGFVASGLYGDDFETTRQRRQEFQGIDTIDPNFSTTKTERLIKTGASGSFGLDITENHKLRTFLSLLRRTTDETEFREGTRDDWDGAFQQYFLRWQEREMVLQQFWGDHTVPFLSDLNLKWRLGFADASLYQPDTREYRYGRNNDEWAFASQKGGNKRDFSELYDRNEEMGADLTLPLAFGENFGMKIKTGYMKIDRSRQAKTRRFGFDLKGTNVGPRLLENDLEQILDPENIGPKGFVLKEITQSSDTYIGIQELDGAYGLLEFNAFDRVSLSGGIRNETSNQYVKTFYLFDPNNEPAVARLKKTHQLPAVNSTIKLGQLTQLRFGYNKSLARPDFRELSPTPYIDDETGDSIIGNPDLEITEIEAYDTRFEWYNNSNESASIAFFYKKLEKPIEISITPGTFQKEYQLADSAELSGVELEWHHNLGSYWKPLNAFRTGGNLAIMESKVELSEAQRGTQTNSSRPLQGQSPYVVNLYLFYENYRTDSTFGLLFNQLGPKISGVGTLGNDDYYEQSIAQLDATYGQKFGDGYNLGFKVKNILQVAAIEKQSNRETRYKERPREYSLSLSATF